MTLVFGGKNGSQVKKDEFEPEFDVGISEMYESLGKSSPMERSRNNLVEDLAIEPGKWLGHGLEIILQ